MLRENFRHLIAGVDSYAPRHGSCDTATESPSFACDLVPFSRLLSVRDRAVLTASLAGCGR